jgi:hypothetical protein
MWQHWFFQFRVSGTNLLGVCKLVFKVSRCDKNDRLFLEENILGKHQVAVTNLHTGVVFSGHTNILYHLFSLPG